MSTLSLSTLHLQYRIWIAALNYDINVIRIFNDHLDSIAKAATELEVTDITRQRGSLAEFRKTIDELKNDLHLAKMQIAAFLRKRDKPAISNIQLEEYQLLSNRYHAFRSRFEKVCEQMITPQ